VYHELFRWRAEIFKSENLGKRNASRSARSGRDHCTHGVCLLKHEGRAKAGEVQPWVGWLNISLAIVGNGTPLGESRLACG
jgi:hypothetical protein